MISMSPRVSGKGEVLPRQGALPRCTVLNSGSRGTEIKDLSASNASGMRPELWGPGGGGGVCG